MPVFLCNFFTKSFRLGCFLCLDGHIFLLKSKIFDKFQKIFVYKNHKNQDEIDCFWF